MNLSAKLDRTDNSTPWGFRMHGGKDFSAPLSIQRVTPGSLAAKCGLQVGDRILKIGSQPTNELRHKEAQNQIMTSGNSLELSLQRGGAAPPSAYAPPHHSPQTSWSAPSQPAPPPPQNYNLAPKPFGGQQYNTPINLYSNNAVDSINNQAAALNISGPQQGTVKPSEHNAPVHETTNLHPVPRNPQQSAVYEEQEGEVPQYKGYTNPALQSRSFKILQQQINSGQENVSIAKNPVNTVQDKTDGDSKKVYRPSETFQLVQKLDAGEPAVEKPATTSRGPFNPFSYKATQDSEVTVKTETVKSPPSVNSGDAEIVVEKRSTITIPSKAAAPSNQSGNQGALSNQSVLSNQSALSNQSVLSNQSAPSNQGALSNQSAPSNPSVLSNPSVFNCGPRPFKAVTTSTIAPKPFNAVINNNGNDGPKAPAPSAGGVWTPNVPSGPRNMKMGRVGDARSMPASGGQERIPHCANCGVAIRGPFVLALDKTWCPDHFNCANPSCMRPLIDVGFVEEAGQLYCENDYEAYMAPRCGKCSKAIMGSRIEAMSQQFHPSCFVCSHCKQLIGGKTFHVEQNDFYCDQDWATLFQTKCYGCQFPIEPGDKWVEALNQNWHSECFNCSTCQVNLEGQAFYAKGGKPYCKKHATAGRF